MKANKIIIWGVGKIFGHSISWIDLNQVLVFTDNDPKLQGKEIYGKMIINPKRINEYEYDYVVIFNKHNAEEIYKQLINNLHVSEEKIIGWLNYYYILHQHIKFLSVETISEIQMWMNQMNCKKILDVNMGLIRFNFFTKSCGHFLDIEKVKIHAYNVKSKYYLPIYKNIYDKIETDLTKLDKEYDAILLMDFFVGHSIDEAVQVVEHTFNLSKYFIMTIPPPYLDSYMKWHEFDFTLYGKIHKKIFSSSQLFILDKNRNQSYDDIKIYVVTHKSFKPPEDEIYIPIHAGKSSALDLGYLGDDTGDHISDLNPFINECTALYWIWKNANCNQYIGLNHYRRYFLRNDTSNDFDNILDQQTILKIMKEYDIIVASALFMYPLTIKEQLKLNLNDEAYHFGYITVRNIINEKCPDYLFPFDECFSGYTFYPCNLFITTKQIMNSYCEWLFSIIIEASVKIDTSQYDSYNRRIIGFMAERLLTVWLMKCNFKIKELPIFICDGMN